tara:strand:+ start:399 stop:1538 length:1140 start_codon:yes stop_codon:yes gene_type:complete
MKIYYWSPFFTNVATIKAVIRSAESLIKYSKNKKYEVSLIDAIGEWVTCKESIINNINIIKLNKINLVNYLPKNSFLKSRVSYFIIFFWNFFKLKKLINNSKPDYLIIHLMTSLPIFLSIFFNKKTKIILRISGLPKINFFRYFFWKIFSNKIYKITCPTTSTYNFIINKKIFEKEKVVVLSDPIININDYIKKKKEEFNFNNLKNKKFLIGVGRLTRQKNFSLMVNFFKKISDQNPEFNLVIIGDGEQKDQLKKLSIDLKIDNKVHFIGYQNNVFKFLQKAECFLLTSLWEDPGFVLVEAALSNLPIISSKCPNGPEEIIKNNGYLFHNNDLEDLIDKFNEFLNTKKIIIYNNKVVLKKRIKKFTLLQHYKVLNQIIR